MSEEASPARQTREADWLTVDRAREIVLSRVRRMGTEEVSLSDGLSRVLATDVESAVTHPPWDNSAMDGYAVRSDDVAGARPDRPVELRLIEDVAAGAFPTRAVEAGTAIKVMTGAPVPDGADGVTRIEYTEPGPEPGVIRVLDASDAGRNIRRKGEDLEAGDRPLAAGTLLGAAEIGVLATLGRPTVPVARRPRVAILSTGDELADFSELARVLAGERIMNSNSYALSAQVTEAGGTPVSLGIARDNRESLRERLESARGCDALVTSAGLAVGAHDYVKEVLEDLGMEFFFYRVRMRPGSPFTFGDMEGMPVFALPGNPVSAMVTFEIFVRPALRSMLGARTIWRPRRRVRLAEPVSLSVDRTHFFRVRLEPDGDGATLARLTGPQGSGILTSMIGADALLEVAADRESVAAGTELDAIVLREP